MKLGNKTIPESVRKFNRFWYGRFLKKGYTWIIKRNKTKDLRRKK